MAPAFELLEQASHNLKKHRGHPKQFRCTSGHRPLLDLKPYPKVLNEDADSDVVYITFQLLYRFLKEGAKLPFPVPTTLVWDEMHWAEQPRMGQTLLAWAQAHKIRVLGLTATPHFEGVLQASSFVIAFALSLLALAELGFLAWPNITTHDADDFIDLEVERASIESSQNIPAAKHEASNDEIVKYFVRNSKLVGKTLIKASTVETATELAWKLRQEGVNAETINYLTMPQHRRDILDRFKKTSGPCVLVVVQIGSTGFDIPDLQTIFLTRNICSPLAYLQVCGRGARKVEGKNHFGIVEFHPGLFKMRKYLWKGLVPIELLHAAENSG